MGPDGVHPYVLNRAYKSLAVPLTTMFNQSYLSRTLPDAWKEAHVSPIFKKGSRLVPSNYRPVSLTSIVCKTMERIVAKKITNHFDANNQFTPHQHGFLKGKSCTTNMLEYVDILSSSIEQGIVIDVLYTDFSKAFDTVPHQRLIAKLSAYGIDQITTDWIEDFLRGRRQKIVLGEHSSTWNDVLSGFPQGS
jgi:hypothetical protein